MPRSRGRTRTRLAGLAMAAWLVAGTGMFCYRLVTAWLGGA